MSRQDIWKDKTYNKPARVEQQTKYKLKTKNYDVLLPD